MKELKKREQIELTVPEAQSRLLDLYDGVSEDDMEVVQLTIAGKTGNDIEKKTGVNKSRVWRLWQQQWFKDALRLERYLIWEKYGMRKEKLMKSLASIVNSNIADFMSLETRRVVTGYDANGDPVIEELPTIIFKDTDEIPYELMAAVKSINRTKHGVKFELYDKSTAILKIAELGGLLPSKDRDEKVEKELSRVVSEGEEIANNVIKELEVETMRNKNHRQDDGGDEDE